MDKTVDMYADLKETIRDFTEGELEVPLKRIDIEKGRSFGCDEILVTINMKKIDRALSGRFFVDLVRKLTRKIIETGEPRFPIIDPVVAKGQRIAKS